MQGVAAVALALALCGASAAFAEERLTVEQAVSLALRSNLRLVATTQRAAASHEAALAVGARLLPSLRVTEEYQHWDCAAAIRFVDTSTGAKCSTDFAPRPPPDLSAFNPAQQMEVGALLGPLLGPPVVVRKQDTNTFSASVDQPILGLLHTGFDFAAARASARASDAGVKVSQAAVVQMVRIGFLQYFEARALEQIASASLEELEAQLKLARSRRTAGVITDADLLRVEVAAANARQQEIAAEAQTAVTKNLLLDGIGAHPDDPIELVEPTTLLAMPSPAPLDPQAATERAIERRPEVAQARHAWTSAAHTRRARFVSLLPEIDAEGAYLRIDGQLFVPPNQWFVGVRASWAIWEWGATFFQARAAARLAQASAIDLENQRRQVAVELRNALAQLRAAAAAVEVAQTTIASAQEAYRVTQALVAAGSATTTDLLDAHAALTTARLNLARARYGLAIQRVTLARVAAE